jgi:hypothetical protein
MIGNETEKYEKYEKYYKYKSDYETKHKKSKRDVMNSETLSPGSKKKKIIMLRKKQVCMNCDQKGGNKFTIDSGNLTVVCNAAEPCNVAEKYDTPSSHHENLRDSYTFLNSKLSNLKKDIITTKLDYLFGYQDEKTTLERFDSLKNNMKLDSKEVNTIKEKLTNILHNKEQKKDQDSIDKSVSEQIKNIKELGKEYKSLNNTENLIKVMVEHYCNLYRIKKGSQEEDENAIEEESLIMKRMKNKNPVNVATVEDENLMKVTLIQRPYEYDSLYAPRVRPIIPSAPPEKERKPVT